MPERVVDVDVDVDVVTFDLFSALLDSRTGGSTTFDRLSRQRRWDVPGSVLYDEWDPRNKAAQRDCPTWVTWYDPATRALAEVYDALGLIGGDARADVDALVASMSQWPLWDDVADGLRALSTTLRVGLLSNVDDAVLAATPAAALVDPGVTFTSERLGAYKPHPRIYHRARAEAPGMVHVATSARDVRGSLEAGIPVVRLRRPGHELDPDGPRPTHQITTLQELPDVLADLPR